MQHPTDPPGVISHQPSGYHYPNLGNNPQMMGSAMPINVQPGKWWRHEMLLLVVFFFQIWRLSGALVIPIPTPIDGVPAGLEYLTMVNTIMVHQKIEAIEILIGFETKNRYVLRNANGDQVKTIKYALYFKWCHLKIGVLRLRGIWMFREDLLRPPKSLDHAYHRQLQEGKNALLDELTLF